MFAEPTAGSPQAGLCINYSRGRCRYGSSCHWRHQPVTLSVAALNLLPNLPTLPPPRELPPAAASDLVSIAWPSRPRPSLASELSLIPVLMPAGHAESGRGRDLPAPRLAAIEAAAGRCGLSLRAAMSLRRLLIRQVADGAAFFAGHCMGSEAGAKQHADSFETVLGAFLRAAGATVVPESALRAADATATPDLLLQPPVLINGQLVVWLDAKTFFGSAACAAVAATPNLPPAKLRKQAAKYRATYGPGGFVFLNGVSADFARAAQLPDDVILLDDSPLDVAALFEGI